MTIYPKYFRIQKNYNKESKYNNPWSKFWKLIIRSSLTP